MGQAKTVKSSDVTLLGKLSEPLKELLEYEVHKESVRGLALDQSSRRGDEQGDGLRHQVMLHPFFHYLGECVHSLMAPGSAGKRTALHRSFPLEEHRLLGIVRCRLERCSCCLQEAGTPEAPFGSCCARSRKLALESLRQLSFTDTLSGPLSMFLALVV